MCFAINCSKFNIKDVNDCEQGPCTHGSCTDGVNSYTCACDIGYSGTNCNEGSFIHLFIWLTHNSSNTNIKDINECELYPCTHGTCTDGASSYTCACDPGYSGKNCAEGMKRLHSLIYLLISDCSNSNIKDINDCESIACMYGSCVDGVNLYTCVCGPGDSGTNCTEGASKFHTLIHLVYSQLQQW